MQIAGGEKLLMVIFKTEQCIQQYWPVSKDMATSEIVVKLVM